jgi:hypothetical protein
MPISISVLKNNIPPKTFETIGPIDFVGLFLTMSCVSIFQKFNYYGRVRFALNLLLPPLVVDSLYILHHPRIRPTQKNYSILLQDRTPQTII